MKIQSSLLALGASIVFSNVLFTSEAKALVYGSSIFTIENFFLVSNAPGNPTKSTGINILSESRNGEMVVGLNGIQTGSTDTTSVPAATLNLAPICLGTSCPGAADESTVAFTTGTLSRSDMSVSGSIFGSGGQGFTRSDAYADTANNTGNANATIANNVLATLSFTLSESDTLAFKTDASGFLKAFVDPIHFGTGSNANASMSFSIDVTNNVGANILKWSPGELNRGVSAFANAGFNSVGGAFTETNLFSPFVNLSAGTYNVTIQQKSTAREEAKVEVPEPGLLALMAIGLLGFAGSARRFS